MERVTSSSRTEGGEGERRRRVVMVFKRRSCHETRAAAREETRKESGSSSSASESNHGKEKEDEEERRNIEGTDQEQESNEEREQCSDVDSIDVRKLLKEEEGRIRILEESIWVEEREMSELVRMKKTAQLELDQARARKVVFWNKHFGSSSGSKNLDLEQESKEEEEKRVEEVEVALNQKFVDQIDSLKMIQSALSTAARAASSRRRIRKKENEAANCVHTQVAEEDIIREVLELKEKKKRSIIPDLITIPDSDSDSDVLIQEQEPKEEKKGTKKEVKKEPTKIAAVNQNKKLNKRTSVGIKKRTKGTNLPSLQIKKEKLKKEKKNPTPSSN